MNRRYELSDEMPAQRDFGTFRRLVELEAHRHPEWRMGQTAYNLLRALRPDLSDQVLGDPDLDPFYVNQKLPAFWSFVEGQWGK